MTITDELYESAASEAANREFDGFNCKPEDLIQWKAAEHIEKLQAAVTENYGALIEAAALIFADRSTSLSDEDARAYVLRAINAGNSGSEILRELSELRKALSIFLKHYPEWQDDLDETCCPTGFVECPCCESGGWTGDKRKRYKAPAHKEGCELEAARKVLDA